MLQSTYSTTERTFRHRDWSGKPRMPGNMKVYLEWPNLQGKRPAKAGLLLCCTYGVGGKAETIKLYKK